MDNYWKSLWNTVTARIRKVLKMENSVGEMVKRDFDFFEEEKRVREEWWWGVIIMHVKWRRGRGLPGDENDGGDLREWWWLLRRSRIEIQRKQKVERDIHNQRGGWEWTGSVTFFFFCSPLTMERHVAILEWRIIILSTIRSRSSHLLQFSSKFWA